MLSENRIFTGGNTDSAKKELDNLIFVIEQLGAPLYLELEQLIWTET